MAANDTSLDASNASDDMRANNGRRPQTTQRWRLLLPLIVLGSGLGIYFGVQWWLYSLRHVSTDDARVKGTLITVSAEVAGRLSAVPVEEGQAVKQGDRLAQIDSDTYRLQVELHTAALEAAHSQLASAKLDLALAHDLAEGNIQRSDAVLGASRSQLTESRQTATLEGSRTQAALREKEAAIEEARARVLAAKTTKDKTAADLARAQQLFEDGIVAAGQRDQAAAAYDLADAEYQSMQETLNKARALLQMAHAESQRVQLSLAGVRTQQGKVLESEALKELALAERQRVSVKEEIVKDLQAKVKEAETQLALAQLHLEETTITSPINGVVSQVIADPGERVQPGQPIVIVNDPQDVWISANIKETSIRKVQLGQPVVIDVDAYPQQTFHGEVWQIGAATRSEFAIIPSGSASAHFIKVTQRIPVRIRVDNTANLLKPGMMVEVDIQVR